MPSSTTFAEANGNILDLVDEAPSTVARAASEAFQAWAARHSSLATRLGGPPDLEAMQTICKSRHTLPAARAN